MKKHFLAILVAVAISSVSFAQTTTPQVEKAKNDPQVAQNAARADVQQVNTKNVADKAALHNVVAKRKEQRKFKRKKNIYRRRS